MPMSTSRWEPQYWGLWSLDLFLSRIGALHGACGGWRFWKTGNCKNCRMDMGERFKWS